ncbi:MAG: tetratricopeptide repeat protein [Bacteroidetes bacterium]|nr:tetratricopeptide repeat protein [Bacteroidota bacterium]
MDHDTRHTTVHHKSSVILCSDIHSFSQKVVQDEATALTLLKTYDDLLSVLSRRFNGFIVRSLGDLIVIEFSSAINAINCAIEIQRRLWSYNRHKDELDKIEVRIGIHCGDVRIENNDVVGDAFEVALFIESLAEPNRILISHDVYQDLQNDPTIKVYNLGKFKLRTIAQPTELYEVLIDSIPDFSKPSASAEFFRKHYSLDQLTRQRFETEEEARKIEETRQRTTEQQRRNEEQRKKIIDELYQQAEMSLKKGNLDEAERALKEAQQYSTSFVKETIPLLTAQDHEIRVHLQQAEYYLAQGLYSEAEAEVNKVFTVSPLHIGAHQMLLRIEEEKSKHQRQHEEKRQNNTFLDPHIEKINELVEKVRHHIAKEEFTDARFTIREIFKIDPNHYVGRQMENELAAAMEAHAERHRKETALREARERQMHLEELRKRIDDQRRRTIRSRRSSDRTSILKKVFLGGGTLLGGLLLIVLYIYIFTSTPSVAVLPFTGTTPAEKQHPLNRALVQLIAYDLATYTPLRVINPTTSLLFDRHSSNSSTVGQFLDVQYILTGTVTLKGTQYNLTYTLAESDNQNALATFSTNVTPENIGTLRLQLLNSVCTALGVKCSLPPRIDWTPSPDAAWRYVVALSKLPSYDTTVLNYSGRLFESAFDADPTFWISGRDAAFTYYHLYELTQVTELKSRAATLTHRVYSRAQNDLLTQVLYARSLRHDGNVQEAQSILATITPTAHSLSILFEEQSLNYLMQNRVDEAITTAKKSLALNPKSPTVHFILALAYHTAGQYTEALASYESASKLGYPELHIMNYGRSYALLEVGKFDTFLQFYTMYINQNPSAYQAYYRLGQAYQWKTQVSEAQQWLVNGLAHVQNAIVKNPSDALAHAYAALFFARLGKFDDSKIEIDRALELAPTNPEILYTAAATYSMLKEKDKSIHSLRKALELYYRFDVRFNPDFATIASTPEFSKTITF